MNPIYKRELQQFLKSGKIIVSMISLVILLSVFLYFLWPRTAVFSLASNESKQVFAVFLICNLAFVLVLVPAFCATSLTTEKENNTFIMLYTTMLKPLNILISNDDGVFAAGIRALAKSAQKRGHKVKVVCPDQERSATGHGLTLQSPYLCFIVSNTYLSQSPVPLFIILNIYTIIVYDFDSQRYLEAIFKLYFAPGN